MGAVVRRQPVGERLEEIDREIVKVAGEAAGQIAGGARVLEIEVTVAFLRTLFRRRDVILEEYRKAGGRLKYANTFDVYAAGRYETEEAQAL